MNRSNMSSAGGFQPFLFYIGMSIVALSFSVVICFSIFYAAQTVSPVANTGHSKIMQTSVNVAHKEAFTSLN